MLDSSGNNHTLTVEAGNELYGSIGALKGFHFDGSTNLWRSSADSALAELGDMTLELLILFHTNDPGTGANSSKFIVHHGASGGTETANETYTMQTIAGIGLRYQARYNVNQLTFFETSDSAGLRGQVLHYAMVRENDEASFYTNGVHQGTSSGLTAPTGGSLGRFRLGSAWSLINPVSATIASVKLIPSALSEAQVAAEYRRTAA